MTPRDYCRYCGPNETEENSHSGVVCSRRGQKTIIAVATEHLTDEDTEATSKVVRIIADSFIRRPSLDDRALTYICSRANDGMSMHQPYAEDHVMCDAAVLLMLRERARWITAGASRVFHFENGKLARASAPEEAPLFGSGPSYEASHSPGFEIKADENAFLVCSGMLSRLVTEEQMEEDLVASKTPEEWMEKLTARAGGKQFCAITCFLPKPRKRFPVWQIAAGAALLALVLWLILR